MNGYAKQKEWNVKKKLPKYLVEAKLKMQGKHFIKHFKTKREVIKCIKRLKVRKDWVVVNIFRHLELICFFVPEKIHSNFVRNLV